MAARSVSVDIGEIRPSAFYILLEFEFYTVEKKTKSGIVLMNAPGSEKTDNEKMRAKIVDWGSQVKPEEWGFKKGDCAIYLDGMVKTYKQYSEEKGDYSVGLVLPRDVVGFYDESTVKKEEVEDELESKRIVKTPLILV